MPVIRIPGYFLEPYYSVLNEDTPLALYFSDWYWWVIEESQTGRIWIRPEGTPWENKDDAALRGLVLTDDEKMTVQKVRIYVTFKHLTEVITFKGLYGHEIWQ